MQIQWRLGDEKDSGNRWWIWPEHRQEWFNCILRAKFRPRSLVEDNESAHETCRCWEAPERAGSEWEFHAAAPVRKGGERSWIWAAVSLSMTTMGPPH